MICIRINLLNIHTNIDIKDILYLAYTCIKLINYKGCNF